METPAGPACEHCSRRNPPTTTTGEVKEPLATSREEAQWAKGAPAKGTWKPRQEPNPDKPGKRVRRGGQKKKLSSDDGSGGDDDEDRAPKVSRTEYLQQADLDDEWWIRVIISSADLGYTATELLEADLPPDVLPYFPRPEHNGEDFSFRAYVKPWEDFDDLKRFSRNMLWDYLEVDTGRLQDWRFRPDDSHDYYDRRDKVHQHCYHTQVVRMERADNARRIPRTDPRPARSR